MEFLQHLLHIDTYLIQFISTYGALIYLLLFAIVFCETGLVIAPFLPGDSLLFAAGSLASSEKGALSIQLLVILLVLASILGNKLNYLIGRAIGPRVFTTKSRLLNPKHLADTQAFYEKHGGKTIILARFLPVFRTFAPFVAGIGNMNTREFSFYNILSAFIWVGSLLSAGYFFGKLPIVRDNFTIVIYGIVIISFIPPTFAFLSRLRAK